MTESDNPTPPHAFTQGVGTVFQFVGVGLFVISMFVCCSSSLLSKDSATHTGLTTIGWHRSTDAPDQPTYSAQRAITISLPVAVCYGMALAALGLGLQGARRSAVVAAVLLNLSGAVFWIVQLAFFASIKWIMLSMICTVMAMLAGGLFLLSIGAVREMFARQETSHAT